MAERKTIDWESIEVDYRAGVKTLRQIAEENEITHGAINKRAKRDNWTRDLSAKIRAAAKAKVSKAQVSNSVSKQTERDVIEAESELQSRIALTHRKDIPQKRELVAKLFAEIEAQTDGQDLLEQLKDTLKNSDMEYMEKLVNKVCSLPSRIKGVSELTNAYKSLIALERQAFSINDIDGSMGEIEGIQIKLINAND